MLYHVLLHLLPFHELYHELHLSLQPKKPHKIKVFIESDNKFSDNVAIFYIPKIGN